MFRPERTPRGEDPLLLVKMTIFVIAAAIAIIGMSTQRPWIIFAAIIVLGLGFLLRFARKRPPDSDAFDEAEAEPDSSSEQPPPPA